MSDSALLRPRPIAGALAVSVLLALAVALPAGAFSNGTNQAVTPSPASSGTPDPAVVSGATPASPIPAQPRFTG